MWSKLACRVLRDGARLRRFPRGGDWVRKFSPSYGTRQNHVRQEWKPFSLAPSCFIAIPNLQPKDLTHCSQILDHATNWHCPGYKNQIPVPIVAISLFGRSQDQRIAPTWTNKSHPFRHTQIRGSSLKSNYKTLHSVSECSPINFRVKCRPFEQNHLRNFIFWQVKR